MLLSACGGDPADSDHAHAPLRAPEAAVCRLHLGGGRPASDGGLEGQRLGHQREETGETFILEISFIIYSQIDTLKYSLVLLKQGGKTLFLEVVSGFEENPEKWVCADERRSTGDA